MQETLPKGEWKVPAVRTDTADCTTVERGTAACVTTLTEQQAASSWGPANLHVMNLHVLAVNVLHRDFLCNLKEKQTQGMSHGAACSVYIA